MGPMNVPSALKVLEVNGSEQTRKTYGRHGVRGAMFGVPASVLAKLAKQIGRDHEIACALWGTGIHEARLLATMTADPARLSAREIDAWRRSSENHVVGEALARLVAQVPRGREIVDQWIDSGDELTSSSGWTAMYSQVVGDGNVGPELTRSELELTGLLVRIEREIHAAPNRTRYAMNSALIGIGMRSAAMEQLAVAAAERIGPVSVDHGLTDCKTPDAANYIPKARKYAAARQARMPRKVSVTPAVTIPPSPTRVAKPLAPKLAPKVLAKSVRKPAAKKKAALR